MAAEAMTPAPDAAMLSREDLARIKEGTTNLCDDETFQRLCDQSAAATDLARRLEEAERALEACRLQAQGWKHEAIAHKSSLHEAYQAATGATGEPGNWNGAEPIKAALAVARAEGAEAAAKIAELNEALAYETTIRVQCSNDSQMHLDKWIEAPGSGE